MNIYYNSHKAQAIVSVLFYWFISCNAPTTEKAQNPALTANPAPAPKEIICPDFDFDRSADIIPQDLFFPGDSMICGGWVLEDTITPRGNYFRHLISNDTCCQNNLYIGWGNTTIHNFGNIPSIRTFHPKMTPFYEFEDENNLYLTGAGSSGLPVVGLLLYVLPLKSGVEYQMYDYIEWDVKSYTILDYDFDDEKGRTLIATNLLTNKTKKIRFKNPVSSHSDPWIVDSLSVNSDQIFIKMAFLDTYKEQVTVPNDID
jgi:hypothetical protein